jgi:hypothetical protein
MSDRVKIDVYLTKEQKKLLLIKSNKLNLALSEYLKQKSLGMEK